MGLLSLIRRLAPLIALGAGGVVLARRRAQARDQLETPYEPPVVVPAAPPAQDTPVEEPPIEEPPIEEPPVEDAPVGGAPAPAATDATVVRSVYDAPPVEDPVEEDPDDPLDEEAPVDRPDGGEGDSSQPTTVTDVVDDLLAPLPAEDEIEDATVVDDEPGAGDGSSGDYAR